jgi:hypothetical protein
MENLDYSDISDDPDLIKRLQRAELKILNARLDHFAKATMQAIKDAKI